MVNSSYGFSGGRRKARRGKRKTTRRSARRSTRKAARRSTRKAARRSTRRTRRMDEEIQYPLDGGAPKHWQIQFVMKACLSFEDCKKRWTPSLAQEMYNSLYENPLEWVQKYLPVGVPGWRKIVARPQITDVTKVEVCWANIAWSPKCKKKHNFLPPGGKQLRWGPNPDLAFFRNMEHSLPTDGIEQAEDVRFNIHFTAKNHALPDKDKFKNDYGLTLSAWSDENEEVFLKGEGKDPILLTESDGPKGTEVLDSPWLGLNSAPELRHLTEDNDDEDEKTKKFRSMPPESYSLSDSESDSENEK